MPRRQARPQIAYRARTERHVVLLRGEVVFSSPDHYRCALHVEEIYAARARNREPGARERNEAFLQSILREIDQ